MSHPGVDELLVKILSLFNTLITSFVVLIGKEFFGTLGSGDQMDHSLVSSVPELHGAPASFIKDCLPYIFIGVSRAIHYSAIAKNDCWLI
jgi:hypothetical protein